MTQRKNTTPSHAVYLVRDREEEKSIWTRVGAAWPHGDGKGFNIQLSAYPVGGKLTIRELDLQPEAEA